VVATSRFGGKRPHCDRFGNDRGFRAKVDISVVSREYASPLQAKVS
jgi:hypothetical protein